MIVYRLTPRAKADLRSIWSYIAADNIEAADRVERAIMTLACFWRRLHCKGIRART